MLPLDGGFVDYRLSPDDPSQFAVRRAWSFVWNGIGGRVSGSHVIGLLLCRVGSREEMLGGRDILSRYSRTLESRMNFGSVRIVDRYWGCWN